MVILVTTPLLIGAANMMLRHVWIVNHIFSLHYCTPFILIFMVFTQSFPRITMGTSLLDLSSSRGPIYTNGPFFFIRVLGMNLTLLAWHTEF